MRLPAVRPVSIPPKPRYPTKLEIGSVERLLGERLPPRWRENSELMTLLTASLAAGSGVLVMTGCQSKTSTASKPAAVAPLFSYGEGNAPGRGVTGCIAVAAPVFLSEEEALDIIMEELARYGVNLTQRDVSHDSIVVTGRRLENNVNWVDGQQDWGYQPVKAAFVADLEDTSRQITIEYISPEDFDTFFPTEGEGWGDDLKQAVESLRAEVTRQGQNMFFGAFYDPVEYCSFGFRPTQAAEGSPESRWSPSPEAAQEKAREMLRLQVSEFVGWLKGQGAI